MSNKMGARAWGLTLLAAAVVLEGCGSITGVVRRGGRPAANVAFKYEAQNPTGHAPICTGEARSDGEGKYGILLADACFGGRPRVRVHFFDGVRHTHAWVRNNTEERKNLVADSSVGSGG